MARTTWGPLSTDEQNQIEFAPVGEPGVLVAGTAGGLLKRNADGTIGNSILSESGSVLTAAGRLVIAGGTVTASTPILDLSQTWNNAAVLFTGLKLNVTETAALSTSILMDLQVGGSSRLSVSRLGHVVATGNGTFPGTLTIGGGSDTVLQRDASAVLALRNGANAQTFQIYGTFTDSSNYRRIRTTMTTGGAATIAAEGLGTGVSGNTLVLSQNGVAGLSFDSGGNATFGAGITASAAAGLFWSGRTVITSGASGVMLLSNSGITDADFFLKLGVNTSAAAGIKRVGTVLQSRLNDDSAFATIQGKLRTDNAYVAGAVVGTGYVTITDSTGTAYRVPVLV